MRWTDTHRHGFVYVNFFKVKTLQYNQNGKGLRYMEEGGVHISYPHHKDPPPPTPK